MKILKRWDILKQLTVLDVIPVLLLFASIFTLMTSFMLYDNIKENTMTINGVISQNNKSVIYRAGLGMEAQITAGVKSAEEIAEFYSIKPAGKGDMFDLCTNEEAKKRTEGVYGEQRVVNTCKMFGEYINL